VTLLWAGRHSQVDTCVGVTGGPPCAVRESKYNALISSNWKLIEANWHMLN
jgi:hypothetical protein